jgi:hypothetical protein
MNINVGGQNGILNSQDFFAIILGIRQKECKHWKLTFHHVCEC